MSDLRIGVTGCRGRMGRMIVDAVLAAPGCVLAGGTEAPADPSIGADLGELAGAGKLGARVTDDPVALFAASDAVIDFTAPALTHKHADLAAQSEVAFVLGTTGLDEATQAAVHRAARHTQVVQAPNMSLGVNLLLDLVQQVARALDPAFDIEIQEMHHRHKKDAPSGTALALGRAAAEGRGVDLDAVSDRGRDGHTGARRWPHRLCRAARRRRPRRTHRDFRRTGRARGTHAQGGKPQHFRPGRGEGGAVGAPSGSGSL